MEEYLAEKEANASARAVTTANNECESLDMKGALEFLNSNGYPIKKGQLYKETSAGTVPFQKFGSKLHFRKSELLQWAEARLIDGNAVGVTRTRHDRERREAMKKKKQPQKRPPAIHFPLMCFRERCVKS